MLEVSVIGLFSGLLACAILLQNLRNAPLANRLLFWVIFPLAVGQFMFYIYITGLALKMPSLYRLPSPLYLIIYPAAYLYVRTYLDDQQVLYRKDYLHFFPSLIHAVQMIPYHLQPHEKKLAIVKALYNQGERIVEFREGGLPAYVQFGLIFLQGLVYCILMYRLIYGARSRNASGLLYAGKRWLGVLTTLLLLVVLALMYSFFLPLPSAVSAVDWWIGSVMVAMALVSCYLFFQPNILFGVPRIKELPTSGEESIGSIHLLPPKAPETNSKQLGQFHRSEEMVVQEIGKMGRNEPVEAAQHSVNEFSFLRVYEPVIQKHFAESRPFLKKGYSISDLSEETGIPVHHLSAYLNKACGTRFNDFINEYRVRFLEEFICQNRSDQYTQEGLAWEAGFSSRISFFNALKKLRGLSPAEFLSKSKSH